MTPDQQIEKFAKGWVAKAVRHEPVEKLAGRLKLSVLLTFVFFAVFVTSLFMEFGAWNKLKFIRVDVLLGFLTLIWAISALQMWRFINLRKSLAAQE